MASRATPGDRARSRGTEHFVALLTTGRLHTRGRIGIGDQILQHPAQFGAFPLHDSCWFTVNRMRVMLIGMQDAARAVPLRFAGQRVTPDGLLYDLLSRFGRLTRS